VDPYLFLTGLRFSGNINTATDKFILIAEITMVIIFVMLFIGIITRQKKLSKMYDLWQRANIQTMP